MCATETGIWKSSEVLTMLALANEASTSSQKPFGNKQFGKQHLWWRWFQKWHSWWQLEYFKWFNCFSFTNFDNYEDPHACYHRNPCSSLVLALYKWWIVPGRALIHVFNNPYATEGYLLWAIYLRNWNSLHPISINKSKFCHFRWPYLYL